MRDWSRSGRWSPIRQPLPAEPWSPLAETGASPSVVRLAARIAGDHPRMARQPARCCRREGRPIRAGDILILVRKRAPFAPVMVSALKARDIGVAGADRLMLTEQIAVQDLIALGDFLCLPDDDLALASVLKSPLFGLDDDDLMALAHGPQGIAVGGAAQPRAAERPFRERGRDPAALAHAIGASAAVRVLFVDPRRRRRSRADAGAPRPRGGRRHRRIPQPGAGL